MRRWLLFILGILLPASRAMSAAAQAETQYPVLRPNGRLQLDVAFYDQDRNPLSNGVEARRARLAVAGDLSSRLHFQLEADFADNDLEVRDAWLLYDVNSKLRLQAGNFKEPFTLEAATSSNYISFLERSLADAAFVPLRHLGFALRAHYAPFAGALGVFGNEVGSEFGPELQQSEPIGVVLRATVAPILRPRRLLHLGTDLRWRRPDVEDDDSLVVNFAAVSETHVDRTELYNTGDIPFGTSYGQWVAEAAFVYGSFSLQSEYVWTRVNRAALPEPTFGGGYVFVSVIPTGETRLYDSADGRFLTVSPARRRYGALELLLRYSVLDLNAAEVLGGAGHDWTLATNWYPHRNVRVMLNYVFTQHDAFATGDGDFLGNDDFSVFQFRVQYNF